MICASAAQVCEADETCDASTSAPCNEVDFHVCQESTSIFGSGGTAMAYVPDQPISSSICKEYLSEANSAAYCGANWPFSRSKGRKRSPRLQLKINLQSCHKRENNKCCCQNLPTEAEVEVWQTRSDGTYSSLAGKDGDCRARSSTRQGQVVFQTLAPGSVGSMVGLGPNGWDCPPYGPPAIHILVHDYLHASTLVDVPVVFDAKTLRQTSFWGPDFRGASWVQKKESSRFRVTSWKGFMDENRIEIELDILLYQTFSNASQSTNLCPSSVYGLPSSFFLEPIAVCAPSMLDFFGL